MKRVHLSRFPKELINISRNYLHSTRGNIRMFRVSKGAVPLDPLQQVMQTRSTRYDPGGPLGAPNNPLGPCPWSSTSLILGPAPALWPSNLP